MWIIDEVGMDVVWFGGLDFCDCCWEVGYVEWIIFFVDYSVVILVGEVVGLDVDVVWCVVVGIDVEDFFIEVFEWLIE